jgi:hypothetical protein
VSQFKLRMQRLQGEGLLSNRIKWRIKGRYVRHTLMLMYTHSCAHTSHACTHLMRPHIMHNPLSSYTLVPPPSLRSAESLSLPSLSLCPPLSARPSGSGVVVVCVRGGVVWRITRASSSSRPSRTSWHDEGRDGPRFSMQGRGRVSQPDFYGEGQSESLQSL